MKILIMQLHKEYLLRNVLEGRNDLYKDIQTGKSIENKWEFSISDEVADDMQIFLLLS